MEYVTKLSDLIHDLQEILKVDGDMPVMSAHNEDNILTSCVYSYIEHISEFPNCLYLESKDSKTEIWKSYKTAKKLDFDKILLIGSNAPVLGDPGQVVNGVLLPEILEWPEDENSTLVDKQVANVQKAYEKALNEC